MGAILFDKSVKEIVIAAREVAFNLGHSKLNSNHFLIAINPTLSEVFMFQTLDINALKDKIQQGERKELDVIPL
ncbi:MAG TPA: hypothetical protein VF411_06440, partial [Bacteroidia bacterium]